MYSASFRTYLQLLIELRRGNTRSGTVQRLLVGVMSCYWHVALATATATAAAAAATAAATGKGHDISENIIFRVQILKVYGRRLIILLPLPAR